MSLTLGYLDMLLSTKKGYLDMYHTCLMLFCLLPKKNGALWGFDGKKKIELHHSTQVDFIWPLGQGYKTKL
jgi:hypothetical protein